MCTEKVPYPNVYAKEGFIYYENPDTSKEEIVGREFMISEIIHDIDTNNYYYKLYHESDQGRISVDVLPSDITPSALLKLSNKGLDIRYDNSKYMFQYICNFLQNAPVVYQHSSSGWGYYNKKLVFKCNKIISDDIKLKSNYIGKYDLKSSGKINNWVQGVNELVVGRIGLELALTGAVSAVIVGLIGDSIAQNTFLLSFVGESSTGKTTALNLATSFFGNTSQTANSIFKGWTGTENALITNLQGNYGIVTILDDTSSAQISDMGGMIYRFSNNTDKARLNSSSKVITTKGWSTVILSTGESSILNLKDVKGGIRTRMLEFQNLSFTDDSAHADELRRFTSTQYGTALEPFVEYLISVGKENIIESYNKAYNRILKMIDKKDNYWDRIAKMIAILVITGRLLKKAFGINVDTRKIRQYLLDNYSHSLNDRDLPQKAYDLFKEEIAKNNAKFKSGDYNPNSSWGIIEKDINATKIVILPSVLNEILYKKGFHDINLILKKWKVLKILDCDDKTYTRKRKFNHSRIRCYVIVLKEYDEEESQ